MTKTISIDRAPVLTLWLPERAGWMELRHWISMAKRNDLAKLVGLLKQAAENRR